MYLHSEKFDFNQILTARTQVFSFDLHGVIDIDPFSFQQLFQDWRHEGHKIYVVSGPEVSALKKEMNGLVNQPLSDDVDGIFSIIDFLKSKNVPYKVDDKGRFWTDDVAWWSAKAQICKELGADFHFDDTFTYSNFFNNVTTKFVHINNKTPREYTGKKPTFTP